MIKLSKTSWLILTIGVFVVIAAGLGLTRTQQFQELTRLDDELGIAEKRMVSLQIKDLYMQQEELKLKIDQSETELESAKDRLRQSVESIEVTDEFFRIAHYCGVQVERYSSSDVKSGRLEEVDCSVTTLSAIVGGEMLDIINFVLWLNNDFTTGVVESVEISVDGEEAQIEMIIYGYEGD